LDDVFFDDALASGVPMPRRDGGRQLLLNLRKGDHLIVARSELMFRSFLEFGRILDGWAKRGVVVHLCDVPAGPLDPEDALTRPLIDMLVLFTASQRRRIATRCETVS
jgi:hypothetical protein